MDRGPGQNHRRRQTRAPSVRFHPLVRHPCDCDDDPGWPSSASAHTKCAECCQGRCQIVAF
jgi:hypothetical protein